MRYLFLMALALPVCAQTPLDLSGQARQADFANFLFTRPMTVGSVIPVTCQAGQLFFNTAAPSGLNLLFCTPQNTWATVGSLASFSRVSTSGSYTDLVNAPVLSKSALSGSYTDLFNTPPFANVALSGSFADLLNVPVFSKVSGSGLYSDLLSLPVIPTDTGQLTNGAGFLGATSNAATASRLLTLPVQCAPGQYSGGIQTSGSANCFQVQYSQVAGTPAAYVLPVATTTNLGGVIDGTGVNVSSTGVLTINYGTTNTTAAAGNDSRIVGSAQKANNLSDLANVATTLLNLKLTGTAPTPIGSSTTGNASTATQFIATPLPCAAGQYATSIAANGNAACGQVQYSQVASTPAAYVLPIASSTRLGGVIDGTGIGVGSTGAISVNYGSSSGTAAQGNDGRITGAAQKANNLADLANITTALANLKLTGTAPSTIDASTTGNAATATTVRGTGPFAIEGPCSTAPDLAGTTLIGLWIGSDCNLHLEDPTGGNQSVMVRTSINGVGQGCVPGVSAMTDISPAGIPVCTVLPVTPAPPVGVTASGRSCTITAITNGVITGATCTP